MRLGFILSCYLIFGSTIGAPAATLIHEDFEDDTGTGNGYTVVTNIGFPGKWLPGTGLMTYSSINNQSPGLREAEYTYIPGSYNDINGYLQSDAKVTAVSQSVHGEFWYRYIYGKSFLGLTTNASATTPDGQQAAA